MENQQIKELVEQIRETILEHKEIRGLHDLIIHDYGPGVKIGSAHAEVDAKMNFLKIHDIIDQAEREVNDTLHVMMTCIWILLNMIILYKCIF